MSQSSEDRLPGRAAESDPPTARVIPFERPPTELQRAVQLRAQESLERSRERAQIKPAPIRWAIIFVLALIPVVLVFGAVDAFVRVFQHVNQAYSTMPAPAATPQAEAARSESPSQPGIVMLNPLPATEAADSDRTNGTPPAE